MTDLLDATDPESEPASGPSHASSAKLADAARALSMVRSFLEETTGSRLAYFDGYSGSDEEHREAQALMRGLLPLIRDIAQRVCPDIASDLEEPSCVLDYRDEPTWQWEKAQAAAETLAGVLEHQADSQRIFGTTGPSLVASGLHEWVWGTAGGRWDAGYYGDAVHAAAEVINQKTKAKLGRSALTGTRLYASAFSLAPPKRGEPRLRFPFVDQQDKETWKSVHQGAMHLGMACSQGIRNPQAHKTAKQLTEQEALEQLGALSVLARWVDMSVLVEGDPP